MHLVTLRHNAGKFPAKPSLLCAVQGHTMWDHRDLKGTRHQTLNEMHEGNVSKAQHHCGATAGAGLARWVHFTPLFTQFDALPVAGRIFDLGSFLACLV